MNERTEVADARPSGRRLALGAGIMGVVGILKMLMQAATLPIMARLLGPSELGLYALAFPIVAFVTMLADGGLGISLAREPLNSPVWSTAFWVLLLAGVFLSIVLTGIGFGEGYILHQPRIPGLMAALSVTVVLLTITVPSTARLDRHGRFGIGPIGDLVGNMIGMAVGVICAFRGDGAWSLAAQYLTVFFVRSVIINYLGFAWPKMEFYPRLLLTHIATGGLLVASRMTDYFTRTVENLVVGQALGTATLGQYAFSTQITRYLGEMV